MTLRSQVFMVRYSLFSSKIRYKPTKNTRLFFQFLCASKYRNSHSCYSTGALPGGKVKHDMESHRAKKSLAFFNAQITKHGRDGNVREAERVFSRILKKDDISYVAMITAYAQNGKTLKARKLFDEMPDRSIASYNAMVSAYVKGKCMVDEAIELFSTMPERNAVSYAAMMKGFVQAGMFEEAEKFYSEIPVGLRDPVCSSTLFGGYMKVGKLDEASRVFDGMVERDVVSWSSMVDGFCKAGRIVDAMSLFDKMPEKNVVTWTSMIDGYMKGGKFEEGFRLFLNMRREGRVEVNPDTLTVMFGACGSFSKHKEGFQIHGLVTRVGLKCEGFLGNSLLTMYCRFGCMDLATKTFHIMSVRDVVSWTSLIAGYVQRNDIEQALEVFKRMPDKNEFHWTTMISRLFSKGLTEKAIQLFQTMPERNSLSWTTIVKGFMENKEYEEAFGWFNEMRREHIEINPRTLSSVLSASAGLAAIKQGTQIHALVIKKNMEHDLFIQNALVVMYSNCGSLASAREIFVSIQSPNIVSFNSLINGLAQNCLNKEAL